MTNEARANRLNVKGRAPGHPEPSLHLCCSRGERVVWRRGGEYEKVEIAAAHARAGQRPFGGATGEV